MRAKASFWFPENELGSDTKGNVIVHISGNHKLAIALITRL